ncbi:hypothetical protein [Peribacillus sp. B2I2]
MYIATSLDGYIAREAGSIDWLEETEGEGGQWGTAISIKIAIR